MRHKDGKNFVRNWFPVLLYSGIIFWMSSRPGVETPQIWPHFDKFLHILEYIPFGFLLAYALKGTWETVHIGRLVVWVCAGSLFYGLTDELHQSFVPGRESSLGDWLADTAGGFFGAIIFTVTQRKK